MGTSTRGGSVDVPRTRRPESEGDLQDFLENGAVGLHRLSAEGTILWANRADYETLGYRADEYIGNDLREFHVDPQLVDRLLERLSAGEHVIGLETEMRCSDGSTRDVLLTSTGRFQDGRFVDTRGFTQDITQQKQNERRAAREREELLRFEQRAHERLDVLSRASDALAQSLDYERTLRTVADLALPTLGDFGLFDLREGTEVRRLVRAPEDEASQALLDGTDWSHAPATDHVQTGGVDASTPKLVTNLDGGALDELVRSDAQRATLHALAARSMLSVPLSYQGEPLGTLSLFHGKSGRQHTDEDLSLAEELARRASAAIVNARLFKEARDAIGVRDDFLSMAGHELRTPLTALQLQILSITKMVGQPDHAEKIASRAEKAGRNVLRLSSLVNELLDISRISAGRLRLERAPMDMADAVREVLHRHAEELAKNGCEVHFTSAGDVLGNWDRLRVEQIATNLLANAMKYGKGKSIEVRVQREDGLASLVVQDHGIGISPEDQLRIFQRFERAVSSRHFGGLGLGLWIARELVDAHGGTIRVESEMNHGATFQVHLPVTPELPAGPVPGDEVSA